MGDARSSHLTLPGYSGRLLHSAQSTLRNVLRPISHAHSRTISELLIQLDEATTPAQLSKLVNTLQVRIFKLPAQKQLVQRKRVVDTLTLHVLHSPTAALRIEAASWLRLFIQASLISQPQEIFVTLVTAVTRTPTNSGDEQLQERQAYLKMIFDCFWPYRFPYPAYSWKDFPGNEVFYPLAPLFAQGNETTQDLLISLFNELPTLNDERIAEYLLPVALRWANDNDTERRCRITTILCKLNDPTAQNTLTQLQYDPNPLVANSARRAAECVQVEN
ncbi:MAG TPA: hypothetical protein VKV20_16905 [Ktedonobacteraceae bacterium]|jgi:hypothetical protein|nr:hypothetical protein [Ktedonobacteraceae bacterium]